MLMTLLWIAIIIACLAIVILTILDMVDGDSFIFTNILKCLLFIGVAIFLLVTKIF